MCGSPDPATGHVPAARIIAGCVPLNLFGGAGSITQAQLDYVNPRPLINTGTNEQRIAELVLSGPAGRSLGEDLRWVLGADYRREAGGLALDPLNAAGDFAGFGNTVSSMGRGRAVLTKRGSCSPKCRHLSCTIGHWPEISP